MVPDRAQRLLEIAIEIRAGEQQVQRLFFGLLL
jgi:hypothetical protein